MKRYVFIIFVLVLWLATCSAPPPELPAPLDVQPTPTDIPLTETTVPPAPTEEPDTQEVLASEEPQGKLAAPPFPAQLYVSETGGFALDYPEGWTVNEMIVGDRGTQIQFLSSPKLAEAATIPSDHTRVTAVIYQWDPKNDLNAYIEQRKTAWEASGFSILEEQERTLELGLQAVQFRVQTPEAEVEYLIAALNDQYLVLSGEGNLELAKQIMERVRPLSP